MPYASGRVFHDADAHLMETPTWLRDHADPSVRDRIPTLDLSGGNELRLLKGGDELFPAQIAAILAHELVHAAVGIPAGHGKAFKRVALGLGLVGPMRATTPGDSFLAAVAPILVVLALRYAISAVALALVCRRARTTIIGRRERRQTPELPAYSKRAQ